MTAREQAMDVFGSSVAMEGNETAMEAALDAYRDETIAEVAAAILDGGPTTYPAQSNYNLINSYADFVLNLRGQS